MTLVRVLLKKWRWRSKDQIKLMNQFQKEMKMAHNLNIQMDYGKITPLSFPRSQEVLQLELWGFVQTLYSSIVSKKSPQAQA